MTDNFLMAPDEFMPEKIDAKCLDMFPLGMAYVPMQKFKDIYDLDVALARGTIFAQLDKPFLGRRPIDDWQRKNDA